LVGSDVDGTLLAAAQRPPSERTRTAVANVLAAGVPFILVTGRPPRWIPPVSRHFPGLRHAVCANGAVHYDIEDDRVLSGVTLAPEQLAELAAAVAEVLPGSWLAAERLGLRALDEVSVPRVEMGKRPEWASDFLEEPRDRLLSEPAIKLLVRHENLSSDAMLTALRDRVGDDVSLTFSNPVGLLECAAADVSKASGLAQVAAELDIDVADVIVFGDMPNDIEMIEWAGHGVAMGGGHPLLAEIADEVTAPADEDGVAMVLERWF
jgi:hypothetical protein